MQITVTLTLVLEVADTEAAKNYIDPATGEATIDYIADLADNDDSFVYGDDTVVTVCGKTHEDIRKILSARVP